MLTMAKWNHVKMKTDNILNTCNPKSREILKKNNYILNNQRNREPFTENVSFQTANPI